MSSFITVKPHQLNAGIGHRFANFIVPLILAKRYNLKYVYQPIVDKDESDIHWAAPSLKWNEFLNFGENELTLNDLSDYQIMHLPYQDIGIYNNIYQTILSDNRFNHSNVLYKVSEKGDGQFIEIDWDFYRNNNLKAKYNNSQLVKDFKNYFSNDYINCALHLRRQDVSQDTQYNRWKDLDYYLNIIDQLDNIKFNKPLMFHIYSSKMPEEELKKLVAYKNIRELNIEFHIDEDIFSTFYHFTKADIFISGQGSLSLMANYLTDAIKLTTPWYFHWKDFPENIKDIIPIDSAGIFDSNRLLKAMEIKNGI